MIVNAGRNEGHEIVFKCIQHRTHIMNKKKLSKRTFSETMNSPSYYPSNVRVNSICNEELDRRVDGSS